MIIYTKLFHLMIDRNIKPGKLLEMAEITAPTLTRLREGKPVSTETLEKLCKALKCQLGDIAEVTDE